MNQTNDQADPPDVLDAADEAIKQDRTWRDNGWTAQVIKNEDDDGWAVAMTPHGQSEPAMVGPWTMGRDKKNPKPLDTSAFNTLVKTALEVVRRHEQQRHAQLHKAVDVAGLSVRVRVTLDIVPDDDEPYATLSAIDSDGTVLSQVRVAASFRLTATSAEAWMTNGFRRPG